VAGSLSTLWPAPWIGRDGKYSSALSSPSSVHDNGFSALGSTMDEITIKTPKPKCRLYWCSIEVIDWRYSLSCWYFRPLL
jgi:hypothetical protein